MVRFVRTVFVGALLVRLLSAEAPDRQPSNFNTAPNSSHLVKHILDAPTASGVGDAARLQGGAEATGRPPPRLSKKGVPTHAKWGIGELTGIALVVVYMVWSFVFEHVPVLHETTVAAIVGILLGLLNYLFTDRAPEFSYNMFSFLVLPLVIFDAGFNLDKELFFKHLAPILAYGLVGTVMIFNLIFFSSRFDDRFTTWNGDHIHLTIHDRLKMASVLSSTDTVAPVAFLPKCSYPRLFAVVFGEGVVNDVVAMILSHSVERASKLPSLLEVLLQICFTIVTSVAIGLTFGVGISKTFKHAKWLHEGGVSHSCALMLLLNFACYAVAEMLETSSILALFISALLCGHYGSASLSKEATKFAQQISEFFAYCAESFVFGYFGLTASGYLVDPGAFSCELVLFYCGCIALARFATVVVVRCAATLVGIQADYGWDRVLMVALAGCMRGTIAFALILHSTPPMDYQDKHEKVLVSTVLGVVLVGCAFYGCLFPLVLKWLNIKPVTPNKMEEHRQLGNSRWMAKFREFDQERLRPLLQRVLSGDITSSS